MSLESPWVRKTGWKPKTQNGRGNLDGNLKHVNNDNNNNDNSNDDERGKLNGNQKHDDNNHGWTEGRMDGWTQRW